MEAAVAHGYLMATVKDYAAKRARRRRSRSRAAQQPPDDWVSALAALAGQVKHAGAREVAPSDSPVAGMTAESFRAEVAEMRAAEYELARSRKSGPH